MNFKAIFVWKGQPWKFWSGRWWGWLFFRLEMFSAEKLYMQGNKFLSSVVYVQGAWHAMLRSRQQADEPQTIMGFGWCVHVKIHVLRAIKSMEFVLVIKRVLVRFMRVTLATLPGLDQRSFSSTKNRRELRRTSSFGTFRWFVECELVVVDSEQIATCGITFLLWTAGCTVGEYKRFISLKYGRYRKSADRNSGCVVCLERGKA